MIVRTAIVSACVRRTTLSVALAFAAAVSCAASAAASPGEDPYVLEVAALQGDAKALTALAARYQHAEGVRRDTAEANRLYCQAARQGYAEAQYQLAWVYAYGRGEARDDAIAITLFRMAADQGHDYAARALHLMGGQAVERLPQCMRPDPPVPKPAPAFDAPGGAGASARAAVPSVPYDIERLVRRLAPAYAVDTQLVLAVISAESAFDPVAISPRNAQGLMQLLPDTAARFGVRRPFNAADNVKGGLAYLRWLLAYFEGDVKLVLAAYNAGERAVERYRGIPPYAETRDYVRKVSTMYPKTYHPYEPTVARPSAILLEKGAAKPSPPPRQAY